MSGEEVAALNEEHEKAVEQLPLETNALEDYLKVVPRSTNVPVKVISLFTGFGGCVPPEPQPVPGPQVHVGPVPWPGAQGRRPDAQGGEEEGAAMQRGPRGHGRSHSG